MDFLTFLNAKNYQTYNRLLAKKIGLEASIFLSEIVDKYQFFDDKKQLIDGQWFYLTVEDVHERTALTRSNQDTAIRELKKLGIIEVKLKGLPARRHFKLDVPKLLELLSLLFPANWVAGFDKLCGRIQPTPPIYKEPKEEPYEDLPPNPLKGEPPQAEVGTRYGKFVSLTKKEFDELREMIGSTNHLSEIISELNDYILSIGKNPYKDYAATLRNWIRKRKKDQSKRGNGKWKTEHNQNATTTESNPNLSARDTRAQSSPGLSLGDLLMQI